jgi:hypothetical protein
MPVLLTVMQRIKLITTRKTLMRITVILVKLCSWGTKLLLLFDGAARVIWNVFHSEVGVRKCRMPHYNWVMINTGS